MALLNNLSGSFIEVLTPQKKAPAAVTRRRVVSYSPADNMTLVQQARAIENFRQDFNNGRITKQEFVSKRREIMGM